VLPQAAQLAASLTRFVQLPPQHVSPVAQPQLVAGNETQLHTNAAVVLAPELPPEALPELAPELPADAPPAVEPEPPLLEPMTFDSTSVERQAPASARASRAAHVSRVSRMG
jgi:hypothetical protein